MPRSEKLIREGVVTYLLDSCSPEELLPIAMRLMSVSLLTHPDIRLCNNELLMIIEEFTTRKQFIWNKEIEKQQNTP